MDFKKLLTQLVEHHCSCHHLQL